MYKKQVEIATAAREQTNTFGDYKGIKDKAFIANFIELPIAAIAEYMHLCLEGYGKRLLDYFFNSNYSKNAFYLNNHIGCIDNLLNHVKYTSSFSRTQRSITFHNLFKANEYRNLFFLFPYLRTKRCIIFSLL